MESKRDFSPVFSEEELRLGSLRSVDAIHEALERADLQAAQRFARRLRREALSIRGSYDGWETKLMAWIQRRGGTGDHGEALEAADRSDGCPPSFDSTQDAGERFRDLASQLSDSIEAEGLATARRLARQLHEEALVVHDRGMRRVATLLSWIGRRFGADDLAEAYAEAMAGDLLGDASFRERAEALMHFTRVHFQPFEVTEDPEKLTFLCPTCPSGGRLLAEGHYEGPDAALHVAGPSPLTWNRESLPVYCCHEPIMEKASIEKTGAPLFIVEPSEDLGREPCRTYLYKNPADIPERFYTRLGLRKPR